MTDFQSVIWDMLKARYRLNWPQSLVDNFFGFLEKNLTHGEITQATEIVLREEQVFPRFEYFVEVIKGNRSQRAQQRQSQQALPEKGSITIHSIGWHTARLRAKISLSQMLPTISFQEALEEALDLGIDIDNLGLTENAVVELIRNAAETSDSPHTPPVETAANVIFKKAG